MITLLPTGRVIAFISVVYAALVVTAIAVSFSVLGRSGFYWSDIGLAFSGATILQLVLMAWFYFGWRILWRWFPALNRLFPDINGAWSIRIDWQGLKGKSGHVDAEAIVVQDFLRLSMEVRSSNSDSQTLIALPKKDPESGRPLLYYVYLVTPKVLGPKPGQSYYGAAILRFSDTRGDELSGNYWTTQETRGHFTLVRKT